LSGLTICFKLRRCIRRSAKICVAIREGTHYQADDINRQLADKERVSAAVENDYLMRVIKTGLRNTEITKQNMMIV
jgi:hypothetical protein